MVHCLIGRKFKRNLYGLSEWTDTVTEAWYHWRMLQIEGKLYCKPQLYIRGKLTVYSEEEIIFL